MHSNTVHIPQLDGFRGLAILLVLLAHSGFFIFNPGWIGVPMFFVLSGFLITNILRSNKGSASYFKTFYARRAFRIFPIYYLVLFFCLAWGLVMKYDVSQFFYYAFYLQSFIISNNIPPDFCNSLMGHTWSLSVEELFYLFWPAAVYFFRQNIFFIICILLCIFSFLYQMFQFGQDAEGLALLSIYGSLGCLMTGALLSLYTSRPDRTVFIRRHRFVFLVLLMITLALIASQYLPIEHRILFLCKILLFLSVTWLSFFSLLFLIDSQQRTSLAGKLFAGSTLRYIGRISYGLYLYHFVVYMFIASILYHYKISLHSIWEFVLKLSFTFLVAALSWHLIEKPLLGLKSSLNYQK